MQSWLKPMLAGTGAAEMNFPEAEWVCEGKLDGHRAVIHRDVDGLVHQYNGRNAADYTGHLPYMDAAIASMLPPDSCVDGELLSPLGREHVQGVMFTNAMHVPHGKRDPQLYLVVFDLLRLAGEDMCHEPWSYRRALLESVVRSFRWEAAIESEVPGVTLSMILPNDVGLKVALGAGLEGVVFKRRRSTYQHRRSNDWLKIKPQQTCDAVIMGFKPGKAGGAWSGKVGAFEIQLVNDDGQRTSIWTTVKCGTDARHLEATAERDGEANGTSSWLGARIEIKHHGIQKSGVPLHPQFLRRRGDLEPVAAPQPQTMRRPPVASTKRRMRNYAQMKNEKLQDVTCELKHEGEAYDRCVMSGSGDPVGDLAVCEQLIRDRGLTVPA